MAGPLPLWKCFLFALLLPLVAGLASPLPFAFLVPLTGLSALIALRLREGAWPALDWPLYAWVGAIGALCLLSTLWSVDPDASLSRALKIVVPLLCALPLLDLARRCPPEDFAKIAPAFAWVTLLMGCVASGELLLDLPLYRMLADTPAGEHVYGSVLNKNVAVFALMLPVALLICRRGRHLPLAVALLAVTGVLLGVTESQSVQLSLFVMAVAGAGLFVLPVSGLPLSFGCLILIVLLMPWLSPIAFDAMADRLSQSTGFAAYGSASARLENWDFISRKIMTNPLYGFGMDATRAITDFKTQKLYFPSDRIMHPHNLALQLWIEFGLLGVMMGCGFLVFLLRRFLAMPLARQRISFMLFCGSMVYLMLSWSLWSGWLLALLVYLSALLILATAPSPAPAPSSDRP